MALNGPGLEGQTQHQPWVLCPPWWEISQGSDQEASGLHSCPNGHCLTLSPWGLQIKAGEDSQPEEAAEVACSN